MKHFQIPESSDGREDLALVCQWVVACVVLGIAFNVFGIARAVSETF